MSSEFYVYHLVDPRTKKPFYIGKGKNNRSTKHLQEASRGERYWVNAHKCRTINAIRRLGLEVEITHICENMTESDAFELEKSEIEKYGRVCNGTGILTNVLEGGEGGSSEGKVVVSYSLTGAVIASYPSLTEAASKCDIHLSTLCAALNGRSPRAGGYVWTYADQPVILPINRSKTPVTQYSLEGQPIKQFNSVTEASTETGVIYTLIVDCCNRRKSSGGGYLWSYPGECVTPIDPTKCSSADRILQGLIDEQIVYEFKSIKEACAATEANSTGISDCCAGRKKKSGGISWRWIVR